MKLCPKCKSVNVGINITPSAVFGAPQKWKCDDCEFEAYAVFPEAESSFLKRKTSEKELEEEKGTKTKKKREKK